MDTVETVEYKGYQIRIVQDQDPEDPREWDNLGRMLCAHKRYRLGDSLSQAAPDWPRGWVQCYSSWGEVEKAIYDELGAVVCLPLYMYDHGGISIGTSRTWPYNCPWDSGQVGYIYATKTDVLTEFGHKRLSSKLRQKVTDILLSEVDTYNRYVTGQVYGYVVEDKEGEFVDSCFGFYDLEHVMDEAKAVVNWEIKERTRKHVEQVKAWIRNKVPLDHRYALEGNA
jgi:hypothetical protein